MLAARLGADPAEVGAGAAAPAAEAEAPRAPLVDVAALARKRRSKVRKRVLFCKKVITAHLVFVN